MFREGMNEELFVCYLRAVEYKLELEPKSVELSTP